MLLQRLSSPNESHLLFRRRYAQWAGSLLFFGGAVFWLVTTISESLYPNYSVSDSDLSRLGSVLSPHPWLWDSGVLLLGATWLVGILLFFRRSGLRTWLALNLLPPIGVLLVGVFPAGSIQTIHVAAAYLVFIASGVVMVVDALIIGRPFRFFSILLGAICLGCLIFSTAVPVLQNGLGEGGGERMIVYPIIIWLMGFGGFLMAQPVLLPGAEEHPTSAAEAVLAQERSRWYRWWIPGGALCLVLGFSSLFLLVPPSSGNANQPRLLVRFDCPVTSGSAASCTLTLTNPPETPTTVQWKLSSASSVQFSSSAGSLEAGHSTTITLTLPRGLCSFSVTLTEGASNSTQIIPIDACPQAQERAVQMSMERSMELQVEPGGNAQDSGGDKTDRMNSPSAAPLLAFCRQVYHQCSRRADALCEMLDALLALPSATAPAHLMLMPGLGAPLLEHL